MTQAAGKTWGATITVLETAHFQMHQIQFRKGGVCSEHLHEHRYNAFYCLQGQLRVRVWNNPDSPDEIVLNPGVLTIVPPGVFHQFEGVTNGIALEVYWVAELDGADIFRRSVGFVREDEPAGEQVPAAKTSKSDVH